jgi:hypothetical protein
VKGFLNPNDTVDTYKIQLPSGILNVRVRPSNEKSRLGMVLFDSDGVRVAENLAPNDGAVAKLENLNLTKAGEYILKLESPYTPETEYTLEIMPGTGTMPVAEAGAPSAPAMAPVMPSAATPPQAPAVPPMAPSAPASKVSASAAMMTGEIKTCKLLCASIQKLPFFEKVKFYGFYSGIPLLAGWLIGWIWGYIKGRKTGKRKALAQQTPKS